MREKGISIYRYTAILAILRMAIFPLIAWHTITAAMQTKAIYRPSRVILIASYLQQKTSIHYLLPILSELIELNHCNAT
jgi:hypothetical protein